jgi:hypothetical protein
MFSTHNQNANNAISEAKMEKIIDAILQGQYSQACLLLLEATSRNPLHYIPYRTYNRLQKQRQQAHVHNQQSTTTRTATVTTLSPRIADLDYIESVSEKTPSVNGGNGYVITNSATRGVMQWIYAHTQTFLSNHYL